MIDNPLLFATGLAAGVGLYHAIKNLIIGYRLRRRARRQYGLQEWRSQQQAAWKITLPSRAPQPHLGMGDIPQFVDRSQSA